MLADEIQFTVHPSVYVAIVLLIVLAVARGMSRRTSSATSATPTDSAAPSREGSSAPATVAPRAKMQPTWDAATFTTIGATVAFVIATSSYTSNLWVNITTAGNFEYYSALIALAVGGLACWSVATRTANRALVTKVAIGYAVGAFVGLVGPLDNTNLKEVVFYALVAVCIVLSVLTRRGENVVTPAADAQVDA